MITESELKDLERRVRALEKRLDVHQKVKSRPHGDSDEDILKAWNLKLKIICSGT
jgi:hypothetical protein